MTQLAANYAKAIFELELSYKSIKDSKNILDSCEELAVVLSNPSIPKAQKHAVIETIFDKEIHNFLKVLTDNGHMSEIDSIFAAYVGLNQQKNNIINATLTYVTKPLEKQLLGMKEMICKKYNKKDVVLELKQDSSLIGGFILSIGDDLYDRSLHGTLKDLQHKLAWR